MVSESVMYIIPMVIPVSTINDKMHNNSAIPRSFRRIGCFSLGRSCLIDSLQGTLRFLDLLSFSCQTQVAIGQRLGKYPAPRFAIGFRQLALQLVIAMDQHFFLLFQLLYQLLRLVQCDRLRQGSGSTRLFGLLLGSVVFLGRYYIRTR